VTTIKHTEFCKYEKPGSKIATGGYRGLHIFYRKCICVYFYQEGIHYCTAHKYSTEKIINAS